MQRTKGSTVRGRGGLRGTLIESQPVESGGPQVLVQLDDSRRLLVPTDALVPQDDGSYELSIGAEELQRAPAADRIRDSEVIVLPVVEEELEVQKRTVEGGGVRIRKVVHEHEENVDVPLLREELEVERVPVHRMVDGDVTVRHDGDTTIIPVLEEVLVVEKRLMLKEELRVTRKRRVGSEPHRVSLKSEEAIVERLAPGLERSRVDGSNKQMNQ